MSGDQTFFDSYDAVELELPTGKVVRCRPLTLSTAAKYMRLLIDAQAGDARAMLKIMDDFPAEIGAEQAFEELSPAELFDMVDRFFTTRPTRRNGGRPTNHEPG